MPTPKLMYQNPVWPGYFADPFVIKTRDAYYAYGTAPTGSDGKFFSILRSTDLVHWEGLGGALEPLVDPPGVTYWAPEVAERDGRYYLYYSASPSQSDADHRLRVAIADRPEGPFRDSGRILIPQLGFSIDASPFHDPMTGQWYVFFATDYETDEPNGTGLAVAQLGDDMTSVVTDPRLVIRASAPWQIYEQNRDYKGKVWTTWNCVEGPSPLYHAGKYYCLYSAGAWYGDNYGVGFAVADHPLGPWRDDFAASGPAVLRGIPGRVVGPGHNSTVIGPDGRTRFIVYHAWDAAKTARRMCIDPIFWEAQGPRADGPSTEPRPLFPQSIHAPVGPRLDAVLMQEREEE